MSMKRITNIDTLSALFDRLITENIKLYFFDKDNNQDKVNHQISVIQEIKKKITEVFNEILSNKKYEYISEKRTYSIDDVTESLETLIKADILTGEGDRDNLKEVKSKKPSLEKFITNHKKIRKANELRAVSKNKIDQQIKEIIDEN